MMIGDKPLFEKNRVMQFIYPGVFNDICSSIILITYLDAKEKNELYIWHKHL